MMKPEIVEHQITAGATISAPPPDLSTEAIVARSDTYLSQTLGSSVLIIGLLRLPGGLSWISALVHWLDTDSCSLALMQRKEIHQWIVRYCNAGTAIEMQYTPASHLGQLTRKGNSSKSP
jgi:hypothetical protein